MTSWSPRVGLYWDLRNPPERRRPWPAHYGAVLEQCEEAERLGADSMWFSEHHLFDDGYLTQPLTFAAAVAARTRRAAIGTAVLIAPVRNAAHVAEEAAIVDILSDGRLELGLGTGYRPPEFDLFGADLSTRYSATDQLARQVRAHWADATLLPAPVQPRVPIWMGYGGPQGARRAGLLGEGLLALNPDLLEPYRLGLAEGGHDPDGGRMSGVLSVYVSDDPERDWPVISQYHADQWNSYRRHMVQGTGKPDPKPIDVERCRAAGLAPGFGNLLFGTPEDVAAAVRSFLAGCPVEHIFLWASLAGMPDDLVQRNIETVCTRLRPLLIGPAVSS